MTQRTRRVSPSRSKEQPFETEAWTAWQAVKKPGLCRNDWLVVGHDPGRGGDYTGTPDGSTAGRRRSIHGCVFLYVCLHGRFSAGRALRPGQSTLASNGAALSQTDSNRRSKETQQREILFASEDGDIRWSGRRLLTNLGDLGMDETWHRRTGWSTAVDGESPER